MRRRINSHSSDPADTFFESNALFRKHIAKDSSCLFRAVAEQVCHSQFSHEDLRTLCISFMMMNKDRFQFFMTKSIDDYINKMKHPMEVGGHVEMIALARIFQIDFILFFENGMTSVNVTNFGYPKKVMLYKEGNHYDLVYKKKYPIIAGFCQALVYETLYKDVFKMDDILNVVDGMLHESSVSQRDTSFNEITDIVDQLMDNNRSPERIENTSFCGSSSPEKSASPPFPYRVAKAIDKTIYRNIEYDFWRAQRREERYGPYDSNGLQNGCKVIIECSHLKNLEAFENIQLHAENMHGYIQTMSRSHGPVEVFIEELGNRVIVPYKSLEKVKSQMPLVCSTPYKFHSHSNSCGETKWDYRSPKIPCGERKDENQVPFMPMQLQKNNFQDSRDSSMFSESFSPPREIFYQKEDDACVTTQVDVIEEREQTSPIAIPGNIHQHVDNGVNYSPAILNSTALNFSDININENVYRPNSYPSFSYPGAYYQQPNWCWVPQEQFVQSNYPYDVYGWNYGGYQQCPSFYGSPVPCVYPTEFAYSVPGVIPLQQGGVNATASEDHRDGENES